MTAAPRVPAQADPPPVPDALLAWLARPAADQLDDLERAADELGARVVGHDMDPDVRRVLDAVASALATEAASPTGRGGRPDVMLYGIARAVLLGGDR